MTYCVGLLVDTGPQHADLLDQGMTDIAAWRTAEPAIFLRFERQQSEYVVDVSAHCARPAGIGPALPPGGACGAGGRGLPLGSAIMA